MAPVELSMEGRVATLVLNRPEARNALSIELCEEIVAVLERVDRESEARVVIVRGAGKVFCAGADIATVSGPGALDFLAPFERMLEVVARHRLPTIAAIQGAALGGGLQLASACDFRLAASDARLGIPSSRLGIVVNFENVQRLVLLAGIAVAKDVLMAGRIYSGHEAAELGLVNDSVDAATLDASVRARAEEIAALSPLSVQGAKRAIGIVMDELSSGRRGHRAEVEGHDRLLLEGYESHDLSEGLAARTEKREPRFKGR